MPIYEYLCSTCNHEFDALQKVSEEPLTDCPECGESALKKKLSAPGFRLSGSGWYETDFKSDKDKQKNLAKSDSSDKTGGDKGKSSDNKSDAKASAGKEAAA
ncbi:MAG: zinc ribbon domain-containing protein [Gammaproteobacteria bacterium]|nr:zinc ribbon domain-containing protein [Gammaproteobacteria bacterium]